MLIIPKKLNGFNGVNYNTLATVTLPVTVTHNEIHIKTSLRPSQIKEVSIFLGQDNIVQCSGDDLLMMENRKGNYTQVAERDAEGNLTQKTILVIPFGNPNAKNQAGGLFGGLVTLEGETVTLTIQIGDEVAGDVGGIQLQALSYQYPNEPNAVRYFVPRIKNVIMQANVIGWNDYTTFNGGPAVYIRRAYFKAQVNELKVWRDDMLLHDVELEDQTFMQKRLGRNPVDTVYMFDPTQYGYERADILPTFKKSEFKISVNVSEAKPIPILVESIDQVAVLPTK